MCRVTKHPILHAVRLGQYTETGESTVWEAGGGSGIEPKVILLRPSKLILVLPGRGKPGGWGGPRLRKKHKKTTTVSPFEC